MSNRQRGDETARAGLDPAGRSHPIGATLAAGGANFSVFSKTAAGIDLLLFDRPADSPASPAAWEPPGHRRHGLARFRRERGVGVPQHMNGGARAGEVGLRP